MQSLQPYLRRSKSKDEELAFPMAAIANPIGSRAENASLCMHRQPSAKPLYTKNSTEYARATAPAKVSRKTWNLIAKYLDTWKKNELGF
jgi:hypothetical protein